MNELIVNPRARERIVEQSKTPEQYKQVADPITVSLSEPKIQERRLYPVKPKESTLW